MTLRTTLLVAAAALACASFLAVPPAHAQDAAAAASTGGQRYDHRIERSRFDVGAHSRQTDDAQSHRVIGDTGVFHVDTFTGAAMGVLTAPSSAKTAPALLQRFPRPLTEDPDQHSAEVRRYLLGAGVPATEVAGMHVTATMAGGGPMDDGVQPAQSHLLWYTSHLDRALAGIPVEGSFAYAALGADGKAISEGVYWPAISSDVVRRAVALQRLLASPDQAAPFLSRLRSAHPEMGDATGEVRIVHTGPSYHGSFDSRAVYSVVARNANGGKARILRFDDSGQPVTLADERRSGVDSVKAAMR